MASFTVSENCIGANSTGNIIALVGTGTSWVNGVTVFSVTGGSGASVTANTVTSSTAATVTITAGTAAGALTLSDGLGETNTITVQTVPFTVNTPSAVGPGKGSRASTTIAWYDANTLSTADGVGVASWPSSIAGPGAFAQATGGSQPIMSVNGGPNGERCLMFNGKTLTLSGTDAVMNTVLGPSLSYTITFIIRGMGNNGGIQGTFKTGTSLSGFNQGNTFANSAAGILTSSSIWQRFNDGPTTTTGSQGAVIPNRWYIVHYTYNTSTTTETLYVGGMPYSTKSTGNTDRETWNTGSALTLGAASVQQYYSQLVVDNYAFSQADVSADCAYWRNRLVTSSTGVEVIHYGDSRTVGLDTQRFETTTPNDAGIYNYPILVRNLLGQQYNSVLRWINCGISGSQAWETSPGAGQYQLAGTVNPLYNQVAVVWFGVNSGAGAPLNGFNQLLSLCTLILNNWMRLVVCTEVDSKSPSQSAWNTYRTTYNPLIAAMWPTTSGKYYLVDLANTLHVGALNDSMNTSYYSQDQVHMLGSLLTAEATPAGGYLVLAQAVAPQLGLAINSLNPSIGLKSVSRHSANNLNGGL